MENIYNVVDRYCSYPKGHPVTSYYYRDLLQTIDNECIQGRLSIEQAEVLKTKVGRKLATGSYSKELDVIEKYRSKYFNYKDIPFFMSSVKLYDLLRATKTSREMCACIYDMVRNKLFVQNNDTMKNALLFIISKIKQYRSEKNEPYWNYVSLYTNLIPNMIKNDYITRDKFATEIALCKALIEEELKFNDSLGLDELTNTMNVFGESNERELVRTTRLTLLIKYLESVKSYSQEIKQLNERYGREDSKLGEAMRRVIYESDNHLMHTFHKRFYISVVQTFIGATYRNVERRWIVLYNYPESTLLKVYDVLINLAKDFNGESMVDSLADMHLTNIANLKGILTPKQIREITIDAYEQDLYVLVEYKVIDAFQVKEYLERFKITYEKCWEGL